MPVAGETFKIPGLDLGAEVGRGAHSVVYRALRHGRLYALKVARPNADEDDARIAHRLRREASILARINHSAVPSLKEVGLVRERTYLVMDFAEGNTLADWLAARPLLEKQVIQLGLALAAALAAVHRHGFVHRDLKPKNIVVDAAFGVWLIDFGLACPVGESQDDDEVVGTFLYSAPEQTRMLKRAVDARADLYGLGTILFECLAGRPPFRGASTAELLRLHAATLPPDVRDFAQDTSPALAALLAKLLSKDPDDRYPSASALVHDLERLEELNQIVLQGESPLLGAERNSQDMTYRFPLIGRESELAELRGAFAAVGASSNRTLVVDGEPGTGKTRLVQQLLAEARESGALVLSGKCVQGSPTPLLPIRQALHDYLCGLQLLAPARRDVLYGELREAAGPWAFLVRRLSPLLEPILKTDPATDAPISTDAPFYEAVAEFLLALSSLRGSAILFADDVQWLDDASCQVLKAIGLRLTECPLLLIATSRAAEDDGRQSGRLPSELLAFGPKRLRVEPLGAEPMAKMIAWELGSEKLEPQLIEFISNRAQGNPLALGEHLRALLDSGVLKPHWGAWKLDADGLQRVHLPADTLALMAGRLTRLKPDAKAFLEAAAVSGNRFQLSRLAAVCEQDPLLVESGIAAAVRLRLVERLATGEYAFAHDRIREALLEGLSSLQRGALHQRLAEELEKLSERSSEEVYATAWHYAEAGQSPSRIYATNAAAGRLALQNHAFTQAVEFLQRACRTAEGLGLAEDASLWESLAAAAQRSGQLPLAIEALERILPSVEDPLERARIRVLLASVYAEDLSSKRAWDEMVKAFHAIGYPVPKGTPWQLLPAVFRWVLGLCIGRTGIGFGSAQGRGRQRQMILNQLLTLCGELAHYNGKPRITFQALISSMYSAHRLGKSRELVVTYRNYMILMGILRCPQTMHLYGAKAKRMAEELGDLGSLAELSHFHSTALQLAGDTNASIEAGIQCLSEYGPWLGNLYARECGAVYFGYFFRGHIADALIWMERALVKSEQLRGRSGAFDIEIITRYAKAAALMALGRTREALDCFNRAEALRGGTQMAPFTSSLLVGYVLFYLLEQGEIGDVSDAWVEHFRALVPRPQDSEFYARGFYILQAQLRLSQLDAAPPELRGEARQRARRALAELKRIAQVPIYAAHAFLLEAVLHRLEGKLASAERRLAKAERIAEGLDAPWIFIEVAKERGRLALCRGKNAAAKHHGRSAHLLALENGLLRRTRTISGEFGLSDTQRSAIAPVETLRSARLKRYLDSMLQVSEASATVFNPDQLIRIALDEIISILGAERGFFFASPTGEELLVRAGRDDQKNDLSELTGYSGTIVDQVRQTLAPIIVCGTEAGELMGADSVVTYGLRSIISAPMLLHGKLTGAVYLDTRLAKGVFTEEDVQILLAIANHIAISVENARAARLEIEIQSEQNRREMAERLRSTADAMMSTLNVDEAMQSLLEHVGQVISSDRSAAILFRNNERVAASLGDEPFGAGVLNLPGVRELLGRVRSTRAPLRAQLGAPPNAEDALLLVPLLTKGEVLGAILLVKEGAKRFSDQEVDVAFTFVSQGAMALENAHLFEEVSRLATTDDLTGVHNRRQLFALGNHEVSRAIRYAEPVAALMLDVDHFKRVNDTYSHSVGDQILRTVADRIRNLLRESDIIGRYGGEEFVVVLPKQSLPLALQVAERVRAVIADEPMVTSIGGIEVTVSIGVAATPGADLATLLRHADRALYLAKHKGRNRVEEWVPLVASA